MKLNYSAVAILLAALSIQAAADQEGPFYWMKKYPDAPQAKVSACMVEAEAAYEQWNKGGIWGDNGWAVLAMGTAWEKCMERGK